MGHGTRNQRKEHETCNSDPTEFAPESIGLRKKRPEPQYGEIVALEYLDNEGHSLAHEDWRSITDKHVAFCTERGLDLVDVARPRGVGHGRVAVA